MLPLPRGLHPVFYCFGGGKGIRTPDLLTASQALYQLSYTPEVGSGYQHAAGPPKPVPGADFEPREDIATPDDNSAPPLVTIP